MASLKRRIIGGKTYHYLVASVRVGGMVVKRERYLGRRKPDDLARVRREFEEEIIEETFYRRFDDIKEGCQREGAGSPIASKRKSMESFASKFTYNTNRIEGSRLTLRETALLLEDGITPGGRDIRDVQEAEGHRAAFFLAVERNADFTFDAMLALHRTLLGLSKPDVAGRLRSHQVLISGSRFVPPLPVEVYPMLMELFGWYRRVRRSVHPVALAGLVHLRLVTIHPFPDGNGRVARLMMNLVLHRNGFPMLDIPYEKRHGYYRALERAQTTGDERIFLKWMFRRYLKEHATYLKARREGNRGMRGAVGKFDADKSRE